MNNFAQIGLEINKMAKKGQLTLKTQKMGTIKSFTKNIVHSIKQLVTKTSKKKSLHRTEFESHDIQLQSDLKLSSLSSCHYLILTVLTVFL